MNEVHDFKERIVDIITSTSLPWRCDICGKKHNVPEHTNFDSERDEDGWPKRWSDPTYLGDGPYGP